MSPSSAAEAFFRAPLRDHRNKRIAHADRAVAVGDAKLPALLIRRADRAVMRIAGLYDQLAETRGKGPTVFSAIDEDLSARVPVLITALEKGNAVMDAERAEQLRQASGPRLGPG